MRAPRAAIAESIACVGAGDPFADAAIDKEIRGIDVGADPGLSAMQNVALCVFRDDDDTEHAPLIERPSRLWKSASVSATVSASSASSA